VTSDTGGSWMSGSALEVSAAGAAADAVAAHVPQLVSDGVASAISRQDPALWGEAARSEASIRLSWVGLAETSRDLPGRIEQLRQELAGEGVDRVVLAGMGGSSLAPEVITTASAARSRRRSGTPASTQPAGSSS
jgi:glucose-6-phosphate isomerase